MGLSSDEPIQNITQAAKDVDDIEAGAERQSDQQEWRKGNSRKGDEVWQRFQLHDFAGSEKNYLEMIKQKGLSPISRTQPLCLSGGGGGIRTRDGLAPILAFQASALGHYATPPDETQFSSRNISFVG